MKTMNSCVSCSGGLIWGIGGGMPLLCQLYFLHQPFNFLNLIRLTWVLVWGSCVQLSCLKIFLHNTSLVSRWHLIKIAALQRSFPFDTFVLLGKKKKSVYSVLFGSDIFKQKCFHFCYIPIFKRGFFFHVFLKIDLFYWLWNNFEIYFCTKFFRS